MPHKVIDHDSDWFRNLVKRLRKTRTRLICERRSFKQPLDLSHLWCDIPIVVRHCTFNEHVDLSGVRLRAGLTFEDCHFEKGLDLSDAQIEGRLVILRSVLHTRPPDQEHDTLVCGLGVAEPALLAFRLKATGHFDFRNLIAHGPINLTESELDGGVDFANAQVILTGPTTGLMPDWRQKTLERRTAIGLNLSSIGQHVALRSARVIAGKQQKALDLEFARIKGSVYVDTQSVVVGQVDLRAHVDKDVMIKDSYLLTEQRTPAGTSTPGSKPTPHPCILLLGAVIGEQFAVRGCKVSAGEENTALNAMAATIKGSVFLDKGTNITGKVDLRGKFGRQVNISDATISALQTATALNLDSATVAGSVFIDEGTNITGRVDLRAKIESQLNIVSATITWSPLKLDQSYYGAVALRSAEVGKTVFITKSTINAGARNTALVLDSATVAGSLFIDEGTNITGKVDLRGKFGGEVNISNATITAAQGSKAIDMEGATVSGSFFLKDSKITGNFRATLATLKGGVWGHSNQPQYGEWRRTEFDEQDPHTTIDGNLDLDFAEIDGPVLLHYVEIEGKLLMRHAVVQGDVQVCGGKVTNSSLHGDLKHPIFDLRSAHVAGRLWLKRQLFGAPSTSSLTDLPRVDLEDAHIEGEANFTDSAIHGDLFLRGATIVGRVFGDETTDSGPYPQVTGTVDARGAKLSEIDIRFTKLGRTTGQPPQPRLTPKLVRLDDATTRSLTVRGLPPVSDQKKPRLCFTVNNLRFEEIDVDNLDADHRWPLTTRDLLRIFVWCVMLGLALWAFLLHERTPRSGAVWVALHAYFLVAIVVASSFDVGSWFLGLIQRSRWGTGAVVVVGVACLVAWRFDRADWCLGLALAGLCLPIIIWFVDKGKKKPQATLHERLTTLLDRTYFSAGFYLRVERWLRGKGDDPTADHIFLARRRRELQPIETLPPDTHQTQSGSGTPTPPAATDPPRRPYGSAMWWWRWGVLDFLFGYGVRPTRAVHAYLLLLLINWGVFLEPDSVERPLTYVMVPGPLASWEREGIVGREGKTRKLLPQELGRNPYLADGGHPGPGEWTAENAFFIALRLQVPLLELMSESEWEPSSRSMLLGYGYSIKYENYAAAMQAINLLLLPLTIAGATGFLKQKG